jgi:hypothetical protein
MLSVPTIAAICRAYEAGFSAGLLDADDENFYEVQSPEWWAWDIGYAAGSLNDRSE